MIKFKFSPLLIFLLLLLFLLYFGEFWETRIGEKTCVKAILCAVWVEVTKISNWLKFSTSIHLSWQRMSLVFGQGRSARYTRSIRRGMKIPYLEYTATINASLLDFPVPSSLNFQIVLFWKSNSQKWQICLMEKNIYSWRKSFLKHRTNHYILKQNSLFLFCLSIVVAGWGKKSCHESR